MNRITEREAVLAADRKRAPEQRIVRMTPDSQAGISVQAMLRRRIEELIQAIRNKDLDLLMTFYARDVEVFDLRNSLNVLGASAYRLNLEHWFDSFDGPLDFELHSLRIAAADGAGFCHYLALITGSRPGGRTSGYLVRGTTCFERRNAEWLVTHEHISTPA